MFSLKCVISEIGYKLKYSHFRPFVEVLSRRSVEQTPRIMRTFDLQLPSLYKYKYNYFIESTNIINAL